MKLFSSKTVLILLLALICISKSYGQEPYVLDPKYPVHDLSEVLNIYQDRNHSFTRKDILDNRVELYLKGKDEPIFMELGPIYWGRIDLIATDSLQGWKLNFEDKRIGPPAWVKSNGKIDVYGYINNRQIFHKKTGVGYPRSERDTDANWVLNQVRMDEFPINTAVTLIIKAQKNQIGYSPYFNLSARSPSQPFYHQIYEFRNSFNIFMFGVTFIILLYHILQYLYLRERVFIWFSIWLFFCTLTHAMTIGILIGTFTVLRFTLWALIANGIFYSFWFFGRSFIESKRKFPKLDLVMKGLAIFLFVEVLITALYVAIFNPETNQTGIGIHYLVLNIYSVVSFIVSIILISKKDLFARYFGIGSLIGTSFLILGTLWSIGIIKPIRLFDPYATGMFLQIVIYSFGINYRRHVLNQKSEEERLKAQETQVEMERIKDLNDLKSRFFANISHEFRTPLSLISGPLNLAKKSNNGQDKAVTISDKSYNVIIKNTKRLQALIDQLLELSKLESGKIHLKLSQGNIIQFIKSIAYSFESMAERKNISLNTSFPPEVEKAYYDKDKLEKILSNLLSNAFKYTPKGGIVTMTVDSIDETLVIEISDTGEGIGNDEIKRIFDRFYRVESSEEKGSGIGLALTKELVDLQNGQISVSSRKGAGTSFKIRLPYSLELLPDAVTNVNIEEHQKIDYLTPNVDAISSKEKQLQGITSDKEKSMVLVVEDNQDLREHISSILIDQYQILNAEDGLKGERMAFEHIPDIIVSDIMMPKKDGYALCHSLKTNSKTSHIPIIMLTARAGQDNKMEGLTQGADVYLTKPFNPDELLLRIKNFLKSRDKLWEHFKSVDFAMIRDMDVSSLDDTFLQKVSKTIKDNLDNELFSVEDLASEVGFSRAQLHRKLKALTNKSANQLIVEIRLNEAKLMLENKAGTVSEVAYSVGYSNMSYFTKSFKEKFGSLPSKI